MKILQINTVVSYGSTGKICRDISDTLEDANHETYIAYGRGKGLDNYNLIKIGNKIDNLIHYLISYLFNKHGLGSITATKLLIKKIEELNPDIIHLHNIHGYYLNYKVLFNYLSKRNIPIVWLLHDEWSFSPGPAIFEFEKNMGLLLKKLESTNNVYPKSIKRIFMKSNLENKNRYFSKVKNMSIVTPSEWLNKIVKNTFLSHNKITTINNGIDFNIFHYKKSKIKEENNISDDKIVILAVANYWTKEKGIEFLDRLSRKLDEKYVLVIIGKQILDLKFSKLAILIDQTNEVDELVKWYSASDIFINPTLFENFPTVNLEALATGTPVITYDTGGSAEAILNENLGIVVKKGDEKTFESRIYELTKKIKNCDVIKLKKEIVETTKIFDKKITYQKYLELYCELLNNNS